MSFSSRVKEELAKAVSHARHCQLAELSAIISSIGRLEGEALVLDTENEVVLRKSFTLLKKTYNIDFRQYAKDFLDSHEGSLPPAMITDSEKVRMVLQGGRLVPAPFPAHSLMVGDALIVQQTCCKYAFLRGAFLASGTVSDPSKGYHFEVVYPDEGRARFLEGVMGAFGAKVVSRKASYVVYVKDGSQVSDLMAAMGANVAVMDFENVRVLKEMRSQVNRQVNCEAANISKTVAAALRQVEDITYLEQKVGLDSLPPALAQMARLRLGYPEASLQELGNMSDPRVGKSGVNHRLRRLSAIADGLRRNEEEKL